MDIKVRKFVEEICLWKKYDHQLFPDDILNILIQSNITTVDEIKTILTEVRKKDVAIQLPFPYIDGQLTANTGA